MSGPESFQTFAISYSGCPDYDDWSFTARVNQACGCVGNHIRLALSDEIERRVETLTWHMEGLNNLLAMGRKFLLDELYHWSFKVVLNS